MAEMIKPLYKSFQCKLRFYNYKGVGGEQKMRAQMPPPPSVYTQIHTLFEQLGPEDTQR